MSNNFIATLNDTYSSLSRHKNPYVSLHEIASILGYGMNVDRCYVFKKVMIEQEEPAISQIVEWTAENVSIEIDNPNLQNVPLNLFDNLETELKKGLPYYGHVSENPSKIFRAIMTEQNIKSYLFAPIIVFQDLWGFIGFDICKHEFEWPKDYIDTISNIAHNIALKIESYETFNEHKYFNELFQLSSKDSGVGIWESNIVSGETTLSSGIYDILNYTPGEITFTFDLWIDNIHRTDRERILRELLKLKEQNENIWKTQYRIKKKDGSYIWVEIKASFRDKSKNILVGVLKDITVTKLQEETILHQNMFLDEVLKNSQIVCCIASEDNRVTYLNQRAKSLLTGALDSDNQPNWEQIIHPDDWDKLWDFYDQSFKINRKNKTIVCKLIDPSSKQIRNYRISSQNQLTNPHFKGVIFYGTDITNELEIQDKLGQTQYQLESIINSLNDFVFSLDLKKDKMIFVGNATSILNDIGQTAENFLDDYKTFFRFLPTEEVTKITTTISKAQSGKLKDPFELHFTYINPSQEIRYIHARATVNSKGNSFTLDGILSDITRIKNINNKLESKLIRYRQRLEQITNNLYDLIIVINEHNRVVFCSPSSLHILGIENNILLKESILSIPIPEHSKLMKEKLKLVSLTQSAETLEFQTLVNGSIQWMDSIISPLNDSKNEKIETLVTIRNIEHRKQYEYNIEKSLSQQEELNKLKSQFISISSHEFRTPLSVINSNIDLIELLINKPEISTSRILGISSVIKKEIFNITELMENILLFGKLENNVQLILEPIDLAKHLEHVISNYFFKESQNPGLKLHIQNNLPQINADSLMLTHVLINLISNAYKYSNNCPAPECTIKPLPNKKMVILEVRDFGIGIPENEIGKVFNSFYRASNTKHISGTGLGLILCKNLIEKMKGSISIKSKLSKGTSVYVQIPTIQAKSSIL